MNKYLDLVALAAPAKVVVVTKNHTLEEILPFYQAGARDFGENRVQEALLKMEEAPQDIRWHMIGSLQKNKAAKAARSFSLIHSVDSFGLAEKISQISSEGNFITPILLQVNFDHEHGFSPESLLQEFESLNALPSLSLEGLMTMAPNTTDEKRIRTCFSKCRILKEKLGLRELSMGMSNDYQYALKEGATILRIGTYLFSES